MKRLSRIVATILTVMTAGPLLAADFSPDQRAEIVTIIREALRQDPSILRDAITALQADESDREKVQARQALASVRNRLVTAGDPIAGNPDGDVTIVEFFDVRCPYCKRIEPTMAQFLAGDKKVRLVYKDLPILGPASTMGSKALLAAHRQHGYDAFRTAVMKLPSDVSMTALEGLAKKQGLDWPRLSKDMESAEVREQIEANLTLAHVLSIQGTPALIIGEEMVPGAIELDDLTRLVAAARRARP